MCKHCAVCCKQYFLQACLRSWQVPLEIDCVLAMPTSTQSTLQTATAPFILDSASHLPRPSSSREKDKPPQPAQSRRDCTAPSWLCCCNPARVPWSFLSHASVRLSWAESEPVQHQKWRLGTPLHVSKLVGWCAHRSLPSPCDDRSIPGLCPAPLLVRCPAAPHDLLTPLTGPF